MRRVSSIVSLLGVLCAGIASAQSPTPAGAPPATLPPPPSNAPANPFVGGVTYSAVDAATVRVFAANGVTTIDARGRNTTRMIAVPEAGHGTGVIVDARGVIVTAAHVVEGARHVAVRLPNGGGVVPAEIVGRDRNLDYALLLIDPPPGIAFLPLPEQAPALAVRQTVDAVGYPLDATREQPQSTRGIISGAMDDGRLQLGISVNPGNSGGPLIDQNDQLVGIVVARFDPNAGVQGIGIAVPITPIRGAYEHGMSHGLFSRAFEGLHENLETRQKAAEVVDALLRLGGIDALHEAADAAAGLSAPSRLQHFARVSEGVDDALLLAMLAAYFWDASVIAQEQAGGYSSPAQMPDGPAKRLAENAASWAIRLAERAVAADPALAQTPFIARVRGGGAPSSAAVGWQPSRHAWSAERASGPAQPSHEPKGWLPVVQAGYTHTNHLGSADRTRAFHVSAALPVYLSGRRDSSFRFAVLLGLGLDVGRRDLDPPTDIHFYGMLGAGIRAGGRVAFTARFFFTPGLIKTPAFESCPSCHDETGFEALGFQGYLGVVLRSFSVGLSLGGLVPFHGLHARFTVGPRIGITF